MKETKRKEKNRLIFFQKTWRSLNRFWIAQILLIKDFSHFLHYSPPLYISLSFLFRELSTPRFLTVDRSTVAEFSLSSQLCNCPVRQRLHFEQPAPIRSQKRPLAKKAAANITGEEETEREKNPSKAEERSGSSGAVPTCGGLCEEAARPPHHF